MVIDKQQSLKEMQQRVYIIRVPFSGASVAADVTSGVVVVLGVASTASRDKNHTLILMIIEKN